jgi:putative salt-induced outer membrane protein YdiY
MHPSDTVLTQSNRLLRNFLLFAFCAIAARNVLGQAPAAAAPKPEPDVLIFTNGDKATGKLEHSTGNDVTFKSDMMGEFTVEWKKIKELHTGQQFAVIPKDVKVKHGQDTGNIPQGTIAVADQKIEVKKAEGAAPQVVPTDNAAYVIDQNTFRTAVLESPGFFHAWTGAITAGAAIVQATQKSTNFTGAVNLIRTNPVQSWLDRRDRTTLNFTAAYGKNSQPNTPTIKTDIYYADLEHDRYLSPRLYVFGALAYDHNFSQGLDLQQVYGGGLGFTVIKDDVQELDFKASVDYIKQQFTDSSQNQDLIGSVFAEMYNRKFAHGILFTQDASITPAWNNTDAYSASADAGISIPVYKRFAFSLNALDTFLNNPPPGFKKNSFQASAGLTYTLGP